MAVTNIFFPEYRIEKIAETMKVIKRHKPSLDQVSPKDSETVKSIISSVLVRKENVRKLASGSTIESSITGSSVITQTELLSGLKNQSDRGSVSIATNLRYLNTPFSFIPFTKAFNSRVALAKQLSAIEAELRLIESDLQKLSKLSKRFENNASLKPSSVTIMNELHAKGSRFQSQKPMTSQETPNIQDSVKKTRSYKFKDALLSFFGLGNKKKDKSYFTPEQSPTPSRKGSFSTSH